MTPLTVVVSPLGSLGGDSVALFRRRMALLSVEAGADVVVDLGAVPALSNAAAQALLDARARLRRTGGKLRVRRVAEQPRRQLAAVGLLPGGGTDEGALRRTGW